MGMSLSWRKILCTAAVAAALLLTSCASIQQAWDRGNVTTVVKLINEGQADKLAAMSSTPFLVDGEIVSLKPDVAAFWKGIVKAGFRVEDATFEMGGSVGVDAYKQFANTMEAKSFFAQYVKKDARVLTFRTTAGGQRILLVIRDSRSTKTICAFKGPFQP